MARPTDYSEELVAQICAEIAEGKSLRSICGRGEMPSTVTVFSWLQKYPEFANQYARAREEQADALADECLDIAEVEEDVQRAKLKIDTRKWFASKMKPKKYGDKQQLEHSGPDGGAINLKVEFVDGSDSEGV